MKHIRNKDTALTTRNEIRMVHTRLTSASLRLWHACLEAFSKPATRATGSRRHGILIHHILAADIAVYARIAMCFRAAAQG